MTHSFPSHLSTARVLLTNDDGIHAPGLHTLAKTISAMCDDVWVVAPSTQQSGAGHSLTLHQPLRAHEVAPKRYAVDGTPTDCVLLAVKSLIPNDKPVDLLISGVNYGDNMAEHVTYSGTIAAAMEGTLLGLPSLAISQSTHDHEAFTDWEMTAHAVQMIIEACSGFALPPHTLLSANIPNCAVSALRSPKIAAQGSRSAIEGLDERRDPRGNRYYWIGSMDYSACEHEPSSDCAVVAQHHIAMTPLSLDLTHHGALERLASHMAQRRRDAA